MRDSAFFRACGVTILRAALGDSMILTVLAAYPLFLPRDRFGMKAFFPCCFVIAMLFNGGMIPT